MPSIKQLQNRLLSKKNSLNTVNLNMAKAEKTKNNIVLRRLNIRKLERQLITEKKLLLIKKTLNPYPGNGEMVP